MIACAQTNRGTQLIRAVHRALQRIEQRDVDLVGFVLAALKHAIGHVGTEAAHGADQGLQFLVRQQPLGRTQADTVVRGDES
jgi:lipopolysaccharide biosynthesis regulator YciM